MNHTLLVGVIQCCAAFENDLHHSGDRQKFVWCGVNIQTSAANQLHDDVIHITIDHGIVNTNDMRMIQLADHRCFCHEQLAEFFTFILIGKASRIEDFNCDLAVAEWIMA